MRSLHYAVQVGAMLVALHVFVSPVHAVTCEEVRALGGTDLSNWAKRLKVTPANLAILLEQSFCQPKGPSDVIVSDRKATGFSRKPKSS